jgi:hypothetical protein
MSQNRDLRRVLLGCLVVLLVVFGIQSVRKGLRPKDPNFAYAEQLPWASGSGNDLTAYMEMAGELVAARDPVAGSYYLPFTALAFVPYLALPTASAHVVWYAVNVGCLFAIAVLTGRLAGCPWDSPARARLGWASGLTFLAFLPALQNHWLNGQINLPAVLACVLFFHWYSAGKHALAAVALAVAISIKLCPLLLLGFLVFRRSFGTLALTLLATLVLNLLPAVFLGNAIWQVLGDLGLRLSGAFNGRSAISDRTMFFTVSGFLHWAAEHLGWLQPGQSVPLFKAFGFLTVLGGLGIREWRSRQAETIEEKLPVLACYLLAILLLLPVSETHHLVFALPALLLLALRVRDAADRFCRHQAAWFAAAALLLLLGRLDRDGPCYFLAILCLFAHFTIAPSRSRLPARAVGQGKALDALAAAS